MICFLRESSVILQRRVRMNLRNRARVLIGVMQPVLYPVLLRPPPNSISCWGTSTFRRVNA